MLFLFFLLRFKIWKKYGNEVFITKITLNQVLDSKGISQNQMAKDTGISTSTLRNED